MFFKTVVRHRLVAIGLAGLSACAHADVYVVGHANSEVSTLSKTQVADLYLGRARTLPSGGFALVFDQPRDSPARERFFKAMANMPLTQVNAYWSRLMFTGQVQPPMQLPNDQAILDVVARNASAVGYVTQTPKDKNVRVLMVLNE